jgi:peroxiredoxin
MSSLNRPSLAAVPTLRGSGPELESNLPDGFRRLQLGESAPDFLLRGVDDAEYRLADFAAHKFLLVVFLSNHCPYSHAAETRMLPWIESMKQRGLGVVAIQPNHPDAITVDELGYSKYSDSFEEMKLYARENGFTFPYLYDGETQAAAKAYGALATPDLFLFDEDRRLRYSGRFDDSRFADPATVTLHDAKDALADLVANRPVRVPYARPMGCAVKWLSKITKVSHANQTNWDHEPISVASIGSADVADLMANRSHKLRLINLWATWCGPCVAEFPELTNLSRRLRKRDFEFISISMDDPHDEPKVLRFLERHHAGMPARVGASLAGEQRTTNNYLFAESSQDDLAAALGEGWQGPIPFTILVAPGGRIVWQHNGEVDTVELSRVILDELGGYYPQQENETPISVWLPKDQ